MLIDTHDNTICDDVLDIYSNLVREIGEKYTLIEWDKNYPEFSVLLNELQKVDMAVRNAAS